MVQKLIAYLIGLAKCKLSFSCEVIVVFDVQQRETEMKNLENLKIETVLICFCVFAILFAIAQARICSNFVYNRLKTTAAITHATYLYWAITSFTETIVLTPEKITSSGVMYILTKRIVTTPKLGD